MARRSGVEAAQAGDTIDTEAASTSSSPAVKDQLQKSGSRRERASPMLAVVEDR